MTKEINLTEGLEKQVEELSDLLCLRENIVAEALDEAANLLIDNFAGIGMNNSDSLSGNETQEICRVLNALLDDRQGNGK